jgi:peptidoglycan/LPS O-acetylase OafA/YrhL
LESLRGLAAIIVAVHHSLLFLRPLPEDERTVRVIHAFFYGHGAVICFFVLSGFVLGESLRRNACDGWKGYAEFMLRRCFRILPAFLFAIFFCFTLMMFFGMAKITSPAATEYYSSQYNFAVSLKSLLSNLLLLDVGLDNVVWSLVPELLASLALPFLYWNSRNTASRIGIIVLLALLQVVAFNSPCSWIEGLSYLYMFYLGYLIPSLPQWFWIGLKKHRSLMLLLLTTAVVICLTTCHFGNHEVPYVLSIGLIIGMIAFLHDDPFFSFLDRSIPRFYGKIYYSFYLLHFPVAFITASCLLRFISTDHLTRHALFYSAMIGVLSIVFATPIAILSYHYIENPFMRLGRKCLDSMKQPRSTSGDI